MSFIVKCPACDARNRVKESSNYKLLCGKCKTPLLLHQSANPIILTDITFDNHVRKSNKPILVEFWAQWCGPCRMMAPVLEAFAKSQPSIIIAKVDTEQNPLTTSRFQVFTIPTMLLFVAGAEVKRIQGAIPLDTLENELSSWISIN